MIYNIAINPELSKLELGEMKLIATQHAKERANARGIRLPLVIDSTTGRIVEIEANGNHIFKVVLRVNKGRHDDCYVLAHDWRNLWSILTCYENDSNDKHSTLSLKGGNYAHR